MKRKLILSFTVLVVFMLLLIPNCFASVPDGLVDDDIIPIEDEATKNIILGMNYYGYNENNEFTAYPIDANGDGEVSVNEILKLTSLSVSSQINDYSPFKYANNITNVTIYGNANNIISSISELSDLANLPITMLRISNINGMDLTGISNFKNLKDISITSCNVTDITEIGGLTNLEILSLDTNNITDVSSLTNCTKLTSLALGNNNISDVSGLSSLTNLTTINLQGNPISDLSIINNLTSLKSLWISNTNVTELNLQDMQNLETITDIDSNILESVNLENLPNLKSINFSSNKVSNISLINTPKLATISLANNQILDLSFLNTDLPVLADVDLQANHFDQTEEINANILADLEARGVTLKKDDVQENIGLIFELNEDGVSYKVKSFYGPEETEVIIPSYYNDLPVTEIGENAFYRVYADYNLETIVLPETIVKIGNSAFYNCEKLINLNLPSSVTSIGSMAFFNCKSLTNVIIPENITVIEEGVFSGCKSLINITIPENVIEIKSNAFYECSSITELIIPDSVTKIGESFENVKEGGTFSGCTALKSITLSKNLTKINHNVFASCTSLEELVIPEGVTTIEGCGLYNCTALTKLVLPKSFTTLNEGLENNNINPTIYGYIGTKAEEVANEYNFEFVPLQEITTLETEEITSTDGETVTIMETEVNTKGPSVKDFINEENFPVLGTYEITVYDVSGGIKDDEARIGSRNIIKVTNGDEVIAEYMVIVPGDVTGNGQVKMYDSFVILKGSLFSEKIDEIEQKIRDFNNDGKVKMYDAFAFLKVALFG